MARNILEVARLIRVLEDGDISRQDKVEQIKLVRGNGDITDEEALDLAVEYFTGQNEQELRRRKS